MIGEATGVGFGKFVVVPVCLLIFPVVGNGLAKGSEVPFQTFRELLVESDDFGYEIEIFQGIAELPIRFRLIGSLEHCDASKNIVRDMAGASDCPDRGVGRSFELEGLAIEELGARVERFVACVGF